MPSQKIENITTAVVLGGEMLGLAAITLLGLSGLMHTGDFIRYIATPYAGLNCLAIPLLIGKTLIDGNRAINISSKITGNRKV